MKALLLTLLLIGYPFGLLFSQIGGDGTYRFLDLTNSAKVAALGGTQIAFTDNDLDLTFYNPSLLSDSMRNQLSINYVSYIAGIGIGYAAFSPNISGPNSFAIGIYYVNYGKFEGASEEGQLTGSFGAAEYAVNLFYSRVITPQLRAGINLKPIFSSFESYNSFGLASDFGITYTTKNGLSATSFVLKNIGSQITTYYKNGDHENLPWDIQIGFSKKLAHAPIRFLVTANHLNKWDLSYQNQTSDETSTVDPSAGFASLLMRHFIFGAEILPGQHLTLRLGYNYQRQKELSVAERPGLVGFSAGIGVKIAKFSLNYGISSYHLAATVHYFSLATNLSQFIR
jgi:hypothetical protein